MAAAPASFTRDFGTNVHKLACLMGRTAERALAHSVALSFSQFRMLMALSSRPDLTQKRIAKYHGITEAAVSRQIEILRAKKLITAVENAMNRRERKLALTAHGVALVQRAQRALERTFTPLFTGLSAEQKLRLNAFLQTLVKALEKNPV